jgi:hypothetical protein
VVLMSGQASSQLAIAANARRSAVLANPRQPGGRRFVFYRNLCHYFRFPIVELSAFWGSIIGLPIVARGNPNRYNQTG